MKLLRLVANLGYGSRREVTAMVRAGRITDAAGEVLYIDDEGLLKPNPAFSALNGRTFPGRGLLVGPENPLITDVVSTVEQITSMVRFDVDVDLDRALTVKWTTF